MMSSLWTSALSWQRSLSASNFRAILEETLVSKGFPHPVRSKVGGQTKSGPKQKNTWMHPRMSVISLHSLCELTRNMPRPQICSAGWWMETLPLLCQSKIFCPGKCGETHKSSAGRLCKSEVIKHFHEGPDKHENWQSQTGLPLCPIGYSTITLFLAQWCGLDKTTFRAGSGWRAVAKKVAYKA